MTENKRADDFRYIPADAISLIANENGAKIKFGIDEPPNGTTDTIGIFMGITTLKILHEMLGGLFENMEKSGLKVELAESKKAEIRSSFNVNLAGQHVTK